MNTRNLPICGGLVAALLLVSEAASAQDGSWVATSVAPAASARREHTAVWTGSRMIVWGGYNGSSYLNTGAAYDPGTDSWTPTTTVNAPSAGQALTAVWTGSRMIVWGGYNGSSYLNTGAAYDTAANTWTATNTTNVPSARNYHTAVWTGSRMIVWGGIGDWDGSDVYQNTGASYNPAANTWTATSTVNAPSRRMLHSAVWTGSRMIVWGGADSSFRNTGAAYDPTTDTWTPTSTVNAPSARNSHTAVWTGSRMIVWGGWDGSNRLNTGAAYDPTTDTWTPTSAVNAPSVRAFHTAVWTGARMIVWGGGPGDGSALNTGAAYDLTSDTWTPTSTVNAPTARGVHTAVWTLSRMIVWGGYNGSSYLNTGAAYDPSQFFYSVPPCRLIDTRGAVGPLGGPALAANTNRDFVVVGHCDIPPTARALSVNLTATAQTTPGNLRLYPGGTTPPTTSSLNYTAGQTRANNAIVMLGTLGDVGVRCAQASGTAHVIIDVNGYFE
jgi:N-acetylneuraminic acid mutarotase